jgi:hypothetical protein
MAAARAPPPKPRGGGTLTAASTPDTRRAKECPSGIVFHDGAAVMVRGPAPQTPASWISSTIPTAARFHGHVCQSKHIPESTCQFAAATGNRQWNATSKHGSNEARKQRSTGTGTGHDGGREKPVKPEKISHPNWTIDQMGDILEPSPKRTKRTFQRPAEQIRKENR